MKKLLLIFFIMFLCTAAHIYADSYDEAADFLMRKNIISENNPPDEIVTRSVFLKMTVMSLDKNIGFFGTSFSDVRSDDWFYQYVSFAEKEGIVSGSGKMFFPDSPITRQDAAVMLARAYNISDTHSFNISKYHDGIYISDYALGAMAYMSNNKIITGFEGSIRPLDTLTRREAIMIIYRMIQHTGGGENEDIKADFVRGYPKMRASGISGGFNLTVKTTSECNIYYALSDRKYFVTEKVTPDKFLVSVTEPENEINVYIPAEENKTYTIYMCAVDRHGERSRVVNIKNAVPNPYALGAGTAEDPYIILNENQLYSIRYFPDKCFLLKNNIELSGTWEPVGNSESPFTGTLDGGGFKISGLSADREEQSGLFGYIKDGQIKNLHVSALRVSADDKAGIIVGETDNAVIENCLADGIVEARKKNGGGIAGVNGGTILNSQSAATAVKSGNYAGGITGKNTGTIDCCMSSVYLVSADMYASGIAGINEGGIITNSCAVCMNLTDELAQSSGRITTNRRGGRIENNYSYDLMYAHNTLDGNKNSINGEFVTIEKLSGKEFYTAEAGWDFDRYWRTGNDEFIIPTLSSFGVPEMEKGLAVFVPIQISSKEDFMNIPRNPSAHYALADDIELGNIRPLCTNIDNGFSGSIDGRGFRLYNIQIEYDKNIPVYGLFGYITGGFIKNISAENIYISGNDITGGFAGVNYGTLSGITITRAVIRADQINNDNVTSGTAAAINYGTVKDCDISANINIRGNNITAGGLVGYNEGTISHSSASGKINASGYEDSSVSAGGICGFNSSFLSELFSNVSINSNGKTSYLGGTAAMSDGGEIYKASSKGSISAQKQTGIIYAGGICGLGSDMKLSNCHSHNNITISAKEIYAGGISGYNLKSNLQSCYTLARLKVSAADNGFCGGITGVNEGGFVSSNVTAAKISTDNHSGRAAAKSEPEGMYNNYALKEENEDSILNGTAIETAQLKSGKFYFDAVAEGGKLGWSNIYANDDGAWKSGNETNPSYPLPLLSDTPGQEYFDLNI